MARNFEEAGNSGFLEGIVNYFPVLPSMQVSFRYLKLQQKEMLIQHNESN